LGVGRSVLGAGCSPQASSLPWHYTLYRSRFLWRCARMRLRRLCLAIFAFRLFLREPIQISRLRKSRFNHLTRSIATAFHRGTAAGRRLIRSIRDASTDFESQIRHLHPSARLSCRPALETYQIRALACAARHDSSTSAAHRQQPCRCRQQHLATRVCSLAEVFG
jgi:hypothetical protein